MQTDLRRSRRYPFVASVEVVNAASESMMRARTSEISRHGCYLATMHPYLHGTPLHLRIVHGGQALDAAVRVIHSEPNVGMGLSFDQIEPAHQPVIEKWLSALESA